MISVTVSEARASLPALLDRVEAGEEVTLTRHGKAVAVLLAPQALRTRSRSGVFEVAAQIHQGLEEARHLPLETVEGRSPEWADELVAQIRADRDSRP